MTRVEPQLERCLCPACASALSFATLSHQNGGTGNSWGECYSINNRPPQDLPVPSFGGNSVADSGPKAQARHRHTTKLLLIDTASTQANTS